MTQHTFKRGDTVTVFYIAAKDGRLKIEQRGKITALVRDVDEQYYVKFRGEPCAYQRFVDPAGQTDPAAYLVEVNTQMDAAKAASQESRS